ncbi:MAG: glycoside hydrolase family 57 protein [Bacteroides sp.]|nr:glycoside hydrolase family 57 protein [Bacteroides sp.]MCM1457391.1 glycoside hydrolase family 57 protein [Lachnoclostridium sp.]
MKAICFNFEIHQPVRLKRYTFFDIGNDHYYYDDFLNDDIIARIAERSYIPAARTLLKMVEDTKGKFRFSISISGVAIEQLEQYVPEFIDLLRQLAATGKVEFVAMPYARSLASLTDPEEFAEQVKVHSEKIQQLFGVKTKVLRNTELIYSDEIAPQIVAMGYKGVMTEGAKHILGWKSPNYVYSAASAPKLKILLRNAKLSEDIAARFSDTSWAAFPLTADKYIDWIAQTPADEQIVNLWLNLETFGGQQPAETGIFQFLEALPRFAEERGVEFWTPTEAVTKLKAVDSLSVMHPISGADEARDTSAWLGNKLQNEAFRKLYSVAERVRLCDDRRLKQDWWYLQGADNFYYMSTKHFADGAVHSMFSPYETPFQAFTNYMNALSDFIVRVEEQYPMSIENEELNSLLTTIRNQAREIETLQKELNTQRKNAEQYNIEHALREKAAEKPADKAEKPKAKTTRKKTEAKK